MMTDRLLKFSPSVQTCNYCVLTVDQSSDWVCNSGSVSVSLRTQNSPLFPASDAADERSDISSFFCRETPSPPYTLNFWSPLIPITQPASFFRPWCPWLDLPWESSDYFLASVEAWKHYYLMADYFWRPLSLGGLFPQFPLSGLPTSICSCF